MNALLQQLSASLKANRRLLQLSFGNVRLFDVFNLPHRPRCSDAPSWLVWIDASRWGLASLGKNENHPFETAEIRLASTIVQGLLALPHHPEMPFVAVVAVSQYISQLAGIFHYAKHVFHALLLPQYQGLWVFQRSLPFQAWLTEKYEHQQQEDRQRGQR